MIRKGRAAKAVFLGNTPLDSRSRESIDLRSEYFRSAQLTFETWLPIRLAKQRDSMVRFISIVIARAVQSQRCDVVQPRCRCAFT